MLQKLPAIVPLEFLRVGDKIIADVFVDQKDLRNVIKDKIYLNDPRTRKILRQAPAPSICLVLQVVQGNVYVTYEAKPTAGEVLSLTDKHWLKVYNMQRLSLRSKQKLDEKKFVTLISRPDVSESYYIKDLLTQIEQNIVKGG